MKCQKCNKILKQPFATESFGTGGTIKICFYCDICEKIVYKDADWIDDDDDDDEDDKDEKWRKMIIKTIIEMFLGVVLVSAIVGVIMTIILGTII